MSITVHAPLDAPVNVIATPSAGGSLAASTTYYVRVTAKSTTSHSMGGDVRYSPPSTEINFTTDATNKQATITWDAVSGAAGYNVYVRIASDSTYYGRRCGAFSTTICTETNSFTIDKYSGWGNGTPWDTFALPDTKRLPGEIDKELGGIYVDCDGTVTLDDIYDAIHTAGYGDYINYSNSYGTSEYGGIFVLKGSIYCTGSNSGTLTIRNTVLITIQGTIQNDNSNFIITLGYYDETNDLTSQGCVICFMAYSGAIYVSSNLKIYGSLIKQDLVPSEYMVNNGIMGCVLNSADFKDLTVNKGTIGGTYPPSNVVLNSPSNNMYFTGTAENFFHYGGYGNYWWFYQPAFRNSILYKSSANYHVNEIYNGDMSNSPINFYDCIFDTADNLPVINWIGSSCVRTHNIYNSVQVEVLDGDNNPISGVSVQLYNNADTLQFSETTDSDGLIDAQDVLRAALTHKNGTGAGYGDDYTTLTEYSDFTLVISKTGYQTQTMKLTIDEQKFLEVRLYKQNSIVFVGGKPAINLDPTNPANLLYA